MTDNNKTFREYVIAALDSLDKSPKDRSPLEDDIVDNATCEQKLSHIITHDIYCMFAHALGVSNRYGVKLSLLRKQDNEEPKIQETPDDGRICASVYFECLIEAFQIRYKLDNGYRKTRHVHDWQFREACDKEQIPLSITKLVWDIYDQQCDGTDFSNTKIVSGLYKSWVTSGGFNVGEAGSGSLKEKELPSVVSARQKAHTELYDSICTVGTELGLVMPERVSFFEKEGVNAVKKLKAKVESSGGAKYEDSQMKSFLDDNCADNEVLLVTKQHGYVIIKNIRENRFVAYEDDAVDLSEVETGKFDNNGNKIAEAISKIEKKDPNEVPDYDLGQHDYPNILHKMIKAAGGDPNNVEGGYQPKSSNLDPSNPPKGGSGLTKKEESSDGKPNFNFQDVVDEVSRYTKFDWKKQNLFGDYDKRSINTLAVALLYLMKQTKLVPDPVKPGRFLELSGLEANIKYQLRNILYFNGLVADKEIKSNEDCKHENSKIWEPHLAGARKCLDCGMVKEPNRAYDGGKLWDYEESEL